MDIVTQVDKSKFSAGILMSRYKISGHRLEISGRQLEISGRRLEFSGRQNRVRLAGVTENAWPNRSANYTKNMLATCSLMYIQLIYIACHIKTCF